MKVSLKAGAVTGAALIAVASAAAVTAVAPATSSSSATATSNYVTIASAAAVLTSDVPAPALSTVATAAAAPASASSTVADRKVLPGVNISGGEFGSLPGKLGHQYIYPSKGDIDYYATRGFKIIRVPFRWQRLQPALYGELSQADRNALKNVVTQANARGLTVVLDMHDYGGRIVGTVNSRMGMPELPAEALTDAWAKIAADYRGNDKLWIGLMNEPSGLPQANWWSAAQETVTALRARSVDNKILVPGTLWTGAHSWIKSGNSTYAESFVDPGENFAFEVHQYFDSDSSGTKAPCTVGSAQRINAVIDWAEKRKVDLFFGEIGASSDAQCGIEYPLALARMNASPAVIGWTAWGGGAWWNAGYPFRLAPAKAGDPATAHMEMLLKNFPK